METIIIVAAVIITRVLYEFTPRVDVNAMINKWRKQFRQMQNNKLFDNYFIDLKELYLRKYHALPCMAYIEDVQIDQITEMICNGKFGKVVNRYQRCHFNWENDRVEYDRQIIELEDKVILKLDDGDWLEICYAVEQQETVTAMLNEFKAFKAPEKEKDYEINIISLVDRRLDLKTVDIKPTDLNISLYYNDDFKEVDAIIKERLSKDQDKGIVLLHGLPGTGKTTYLRHLIGSMKKKVMFVSPAVAENLMNPEFMDLLIDNPNSVLVIEDAAMIIVSIFLFFVNKAGRGFDDL